MRFALLRIRIRRDLHSVRGESCDLSLVVPGPASVPVFPPACPLANDQLFQGGRETALPARGLQRSSHQENTENQSENALNGSLDRDNR
jgi:hypothetical protein